MSTNTQLRCVWCLLIVGILLMSISPSSTWIDGLLGNSDMSRWVHFLAYMAVLSMPFVAWKGRTSTAVIVAVMGMGFAIEIFQMLASRSGTNKQDVFADISGMVGGMLLGFNVRMLRSSIKGKLGIESELSRSGTTPIERTASGS